MFRCEAGSSWADSDEGVDDSTCRDKSMTPLLSITSHVPTAATCTNFPDKSDDLSDVWIEPSADSDSEYEPEPDDEHGDGDMSGEFGVFEYEEDFEP